MGRVAQMFLGLRFRLLLLVLVVCTPLVALTLHTASEERRRQVANWQQRTQRLMQVASREESDLLGAARQLLLALAESSAVRTGSEEGCRRLLQDLVATYPRYVNIGVVRTNGQLVASAVPVAEGFNLGPRRFFRDALDNRGFSIGEFPGKMRSTINFGYPVFDRAGQVSGVVFATVDLARIKSEIPAQMPRGGTWIMIDAKGNMLARYPKPANWIGRLLDAEPLLQAALNGKETVLEADSPQGMPTVYGFASMPSQLGGGKAVAILSIPKHSLFSTADRALKRNLTWMAVAVGVALVLGWLGSNVLVLRPIKALVRSSLRLASGDLSARTGLRHGRDELGQLTYSFDRMAQTLEQREKERQRASKKLQVLSHRLVEVQESERRSIARELHDEIGQALTAAEMNLQAALKAPNQGRALERRIQASIQAVEHVLEQVHDLSLNLRPSMLDDLGLESALRWYTHRQADLAGLRAEFQPVPLKDRLDPVIETECFRVAQEALTNVVRHAQARSVVVKLEQRDGNLHLLVSDDGVGFDVRALRDRAVRGASLGLLSMEERASLAGGGLEYQSAPGQGTTVHAWFPTAWKGPQTPALEVKE